MVKELIKILKEVDIPFDAKYEILDKYLAKETELKIEKENNNEKI